MQSSCTTFTHTHRLCSQNIHTYSSYCMYVCTCMHTYIHILYNGTYWHSHRFCGLEIFSKIYQILCSSINVTESGLGVLYLINGSMCGVELLIKHEASYLEPEKQLLWSVYYRRTVGHRCQGNMQHYLLIRLDWDAAFFRVVLHHAVCSERMYIGIMQQFKKWLHTSICRYSSFTEK